MKIYTKLIVVLSVLSVPAGFVFADTKVLSLVSSSGYNLISADEGDLISVEVRVDNAATVAAAAFTVTYDTTNLALRAQSPVTSTFFDTFVKQGLLTDPAYVTVAGDTTEYYSPLVTNEVTTGATTGVVLAAARVDNGTGTDATLFTLHFELIGNPGTYTISIIPTVLSNTDAGYSALGEEIPLLVGIGANDYPAHTVATPINAYIVVSGDWEDTDGDGINDAWEMANVPAGTTAEQVLEVYTARGDYDSDGYTDLQEYLNRNELDQDDKPYDPKVFNAPEGTGYGKNIAIPAINFLLLGS